MNIIYYIKTQRKKSRMTRKLVFIEYFKYSGAVMIMLNVPTEI